MVECWLPYGKTEVYVTIDLRDILSIAEPPKIEPTAQTKEIIHEIPKVDRIRYRRDSALTILLYNRGEEIPPRSLSWNGWLIIEKPTCRCHIYHEQYTK